jgi:hypothetical protein
MQISASEVSKLLTANGARIAKPGKPDLDFVKLTADDLPKPVELDPADVARGVEAVAAAPDVREDIVMHFKDVIDRGEYKVSGDEIAEMIVRRMKADRIR